MSWLFGSHKKKDPPPVTIDPNPIESGFYCVQNNVQSQPSDNPAQSQSHQPLYPNLNGGYPQPYPSSSLPYNVLPETGVPRPPVPLPRKNQLHTRASSVEPSNQLESIPFRIAPHLQSNSNGTDNLVSLDESTKRFDKLKKVIDSGEFDYDFGLEKRILREARLIQQHVAY